MQPLALLMVFLGGGFGSICRYSISWGMDKAFTPSLPWATLLSNGLSTALLGLIVWRAAPQLSHHAMLFLTIGFCGGFSTFSTFSLETFNLMKTGQYGWAAANIIISLLTTLIVLFILSKSIK